MVIDEQDTARDAPAPPAPARASATTAIGAVCAVALLAAGVFVGWARLAAGRDAQRPEAAETEAAPTTLATGVAPGPVPERLPPEVDGPVVGVAALDALPAGLSDDQCGAGEVAWDAAPALSDVVVTPELVGFTFTGEGQMQFAGPGQPTDQRVSVSCFVWQDGANLGSGSTGAVPEDQAGQFGGFGTCCTSDGRSIAARTTTAPAGAEWALQERNGWWLAYPVPDSEAVQLSWTYREGRFGNGQPPSSHVLFVDGDGRILDDTIVRF